MSSLTGNIRGLSVSQKRSLERFFSRSVPRDEIIHGELARELCELTQSIGRRIALVIRRDGKIADVVLGTKNIFYLPDFGRMRVAEGRLRKLRVVYALPSQKGASRQPPELSRDVRTDLEKLRLDCVAVVRLERGGISMGYASLAPEPPEHTRTALVEGHAPNIFQKSPSLSELIEHAEAEFGQDKTKGRGAAREGALLVGMYGARAQDSESSMRELRELARTAGVHVLGEVIQRRAPNPKTLIGKGKLEEIVLESLRCGASLLIFDMELKPAQWRSITNSTELKVLDRSMLILDIFSQRAKSDEGKLQVELAQCQYHLPRLSELDSGLSRLTGGIGGRGPGETKLEIGRRRLRDRIHFLKEKIEKLKSQRALQDSRRRERGVPLVSLLGYTNAGKSTLFNVLANTKVFAEDKLFATLEPTRRRISWNVGESGEERIEFVLSDTVGFIRDLPEELIQAFAATLDELYESRLLVHVLDISDPDYPERSAAVEGILKQMNLQDLPLVLVLHKCDTVEDTSTLPKEYASRGICVSSKSRIGLEELREVIVGVLRGEE